MSYIIINEETYTIDTEKTALLAGFEMACSGVISADICVGDPYCPDSYANGQVFLSATDLKGLLELLKEAKAEFSNPDAFGYDFVQSADLSSLPTYGGEEPTDTQGIWSWDEDYLLVGSCIDDMKLVTREEWEAE